MTKYDVSIITITKNDPEGLNKTSSSIFKLIFQGEIEWLVLDGSNENIFLKNKKIISLLDTQKNLTSQQINLNILSINGIYKSMDYGLKIAKGESIIFMNGGDEFFNKNSISKLYNGLKGLNNKNSFSFGQALIYKNNYLKWKFPHQNISNIKSWLKHTEPNHQSMLIMSKFAKNFKFYGFGDLYADEYWKRRIIENASDFYYLNELTCIFNLDGISNKKLKFKQLLKEINADYCSILRKIIIIIKFLIPNFIFIFYPYMMKFKNKISGLFF